MANGKLDNIGNGVGLLYVTDPTGLIFLANITNNSQGAQSLLNLALTASPLSGEVLAYSTITCTSTAGTGSDQVTNVTVNGVSIMGASSVTGATPFLLMANLAVAINSAQSTPKYSAFSVAGQLVIQASNGSGIAPNSFVVVVTTAGTVSLTNTNMGGGAVTSGVYSTGFNGKRFWINANSSAVQGSLNGATEITANIVLRGQQSGLVIQGTIAIPIAVVANSTSLPLIPRLSQTQLVIIDTVAAGPASNLTAIPTSGYIDGDILELRGAAITDVVTIVSTTGSSGAIQTQAGVSWLSGDQNASIQIQYVAATDTWVEISRTPNLNFSTSSVRGQGIPWAVPGVRLVTMPTGGTLTLVPGVDKGVCIMIGNPGLSSSYNVTTGGTPLDGDTFVVIYHATPTVSPGNTVTIFGSLLTTTQAQSGALRVVSTYSSGQGAWATAVVQDFTGQDWATVSSVTGKEPALGNPAANGYILQSTTAGVRSWVPSPSVVETVQFITPVTGNTIVAAANTTQLISNNSNIAALTVTFPANPVEGQRFGVSFLGTITTLTVQTSDGSALNGTVVTSAANSSGRWVYQTGNGGTWYKA